MHVWIAVGAGVRQDTQLIVTIGRVADSGEHDSAGTYTAKDQAGDTAVAELHIEVRRGEGTDAGLANHDVAFFRGHLLMDGRG